LKFVSSHGLIVFHVADQRAIALSEFGSRQIKHAPAGHSVVHMLLQFPSAMRVQETDTMRTRLNAYVVTHIQEQVRQV